jgi:hypothetical protein
VSGSATVVASETAEKALALLDELRRIKRITEIYVVGGDGTFNLVLNWVLARSKHERPAIMPIGGGEICYMSRHLGIDARDVCGNLRKIFHHGVLPQHIEWSPLAVQEEGVAKPFYTAVFATGIIHRFVGWYEELGKGSMLVVLFMVCMAIPIVISDRFRRWHGKLEGSFGRVRVGYWDLPQHAYTGMVLSTIPVMIPWCDPFRGEPKDSQFYAIAYWGTLRRLACILPWVWFGREVPFSEMFFHNRPVDTVTIKTHDPEFVADGDLVSYRTQDGLFDGWSHSVRIRLGPRVTLLGYRS